MHEIERSVLIRVVWIPGSGEENFWMPGREAEKLKISCVQVAEVKKSTFHGHSGSKMENPKISGFRAAEQCP